MNSERLNQSGLYKEAALPQERILIKVDFDRTLAGPKYPEGLLYHIAGPLKFPYSPIAGATEGIKLLKEQPDIIFGGILTARNRFIKAHTVWQANQVSPGEQIAYTTQSFTAKITNLLEMAQMEEKANSSTKITRTVLVDDNVKRMRKAATVLSDNPDYRDLMNKYRFTLVAFNTPDNINLEPLSNGAMDIVPMQDWNPDTINATLSRLRE